MWVEFPHREGRYRTGVQCLRPRGIQPQILENIYCPGRGAFVPGCGGTFTLPRGAALAERWLHESQPISDRPMWVGFPHRAGRHRPGGSPPSSPGFWSCRCMLYNLGVEPHPTRVQRDLGASLLGGGNSCCALALHEPQPIGNQPMWVGCPQRAGRYRTEGPPALSPGCWSSNCRETFMVRGQEPFVRGCGGVSTLSREPRNGSIDRPSRSTISRWGWGFHTCGLVSTGGIIVFVPRGRWSCRCIDLCLIRGWEVIPPGAAGPWRCLEGKRLLRNGSMSPVLVYAWLQV